MKAPPVVVKIFQRHPPECDPACGGVNILNRVSVMRINGRNFYGGYYTCRKCGMNNEIMESSKEKIIGRSRGNPWWVNRQSGGLRNASKSGD